MTRIQLVWTSALVVLVVLVLAKLHGLYDRDELVIRKSTLGELPKLIEVAAVAGVVTYFARNQVLVREWHEAGVFIFLAAMIFVFMLLGRVLARRIARSVTPEEQCVGVGDIDVFMGLRQRMSDVKGTKLVGVVTADQLPRSVSGLHDFAAGVHAHRIIIAPGSNMLDEETADLISMARMAGLRVSLLPGVMAAFGGGRAVDQLGGYTVVGIPHFGLSRSSSAIKHAFDLVAASVVLILLAPLMLAAAIWIKLDSPGPVLFQQTRVGRDGRRFLIWKFRSMVDGADDLKVELAHLNEAGDGMFKISADPRVTRSGAWLRRTRADELPQLFNVLRGEMSLVGPRPLIVEEDERIVGRGRTRLHLRPGMTGPWQVLGSNSRLMPITEMASLDYMYAANWSLWEDAYILLRTIGLVARARGV